MKRRLLSFVLVFLSFSCERHTQETIVQGAPPKKIVNMNLIETMISSIPKTDYFVIKNLLETENLELNIPNENGKLLLSSAIENDQLLIGELFVEFGADPLFVDAQGQTPEQVAANSNFPNEWQAIFSRKEISKEALALRVFDLLLKTFVSNESEKLPIFKLYFDKGADFAAIDSENYTFLMRAASKKLTSIIDILCGSSDTNPDYIREIIRRGRVVGTQTALSLANDTGDLATINAVDNCRAMD